MQEIDYSKYGAVPVTQQASSNQIDYSKYGAVPVQQVDREQSSLDKIANSAPVNSILGAGDALHNLLTVGTHNPHSSSGTAYDIGRIGGNIAGFGMLGAPAFAVRGGATALPLLGKAAEYMGKQGLLPAMARLSAGGAAYEGATQGDNRLLGAWLGAAGGAIGGGLAHAISALRPSRLFKSNLSNQELARNAQIAGSTGTGLGDIIESPSMKHALENMAGRNPFSGYDKKTADTAQEIVKQGDSFIGKYLGKTNPLEVDSKIKEGLLKAYEGQRKAKNNLYAEANDIADKNVVAVQTKKFTDYSKEKKDLLESTEFLKHDPENKKLIGQLTNYGKGAVESVDPATGLKTQKFPEVSLTEANILSGKLRDLSKKYSSSPDPGSRYQGEILVKLSQSLKSDVKESIESSGNKELKDAFESAEQNYRKNFSQYLDKDIYNFIGKDKSEEDIVSTFLKTGRNTDKGRHLNKLISKLDPETQNLFKYSYLSRAVEGENGFEKVNPSRLSTLLSKNNLGSKQKSVLFSPEERIKLDAYSKLVKMNPDSLSRMFNPKTGQRNAEYGTALMHSLTSGLGGIAGYEQGGTPGALAGIGLGMALPAMLSKYAVSKMTSPQYRQKFIEQIIKNRKKPSVTGASISGNLGSQLLGSIPGS